MTAPTWTVPGPGVYSDVPADAREVALKDGLTAVVDRAAYSLVNPFNWRPLYGHAGKVYATARYADRTIYMHRLILKAPAGIEVDHINGDGLDNRRANLRLATASQNSANTGKPRTGLTSRFKGVSWDRSRNLWQAKITVLGHCRNLGRYANEDDAGRAYDVAALAAWGEFARLNFPAASR